MFAYRVVHAINQAYPVVILFVYIGALVLALALMFVHPFATILLLWVGLLGLVAAIVSGGFLRMIERWLARSSRDGGVCPGCGHLLAARPGLPPAWRCEACSLAVPPSGEEQPSPPDPVSGSEQPGEG